MNDAIALTWFGNLALVSGQYVELTPTAEITDVGQATLLNTIGVGLTLWEGPFEETSPRQYLSLIKTG